MNEPYFRLDLDLLLRLDIVRRGLLPRLLRVPPATLYPVVLRIEFPASLANLVAPFNVSVVPVDIVLPKLLK